jgi:hypothetical protein
MTPARLGSALSWRLLALLLALASSGCELVADFDRSRIPMEAVDGGAGGLPDGAVAPTAGSPASDSGTSAPDAGSPSDAAAPDAAPALDAGRLPAVDAAAPDDAG